MSGGHWVRVVKVKNSTLPETRAWRAAANGTAENRRGEQESRFYLAGYTSSFGRSKSVAISTDAGTSRLVFNVFFAKKR